VSAREAGWVKLPIRRALAWSALSGYVRAMGTELFRAHQEAEQPISGNWKLALARSLELDGRDRPPFFKALDEMVSAGVLVVTESSVRLLYTDATLAVHRKHVDGASNSLPTHTGITSQSQLAASQRNDSEQASQIERKNKEDETRASARDGGHGDSDTEHEAPLLGKLDSQHVCAEWHRQAHAPNGCPSANHPTSMHRAAYETIASSLNAEPDPEVACANLMKWFWHNEAGPIQGRRVRRDRATPRSLAVRITSDLETALGRGGAVLTLAPPATHERPRPKLPTLEPGKPDGTRAPPEVRAQYGRKVGVA
jgi:hypothetical protein